MYIGNVYWYARQTQFAESAKEGRAKIKYLKFIVRTHIMWDDSSNSRWGIKVTRIIEGLISVLWDSYHATKQKVQVYTFCFVHIHTATGESTERFVKLTYSYR